jgi:hypothetical protein
MLSTIFLCCALCLIPTLIIIVDTATKETK